MTEKTVGALVGSAEKIVIIQADNPDGDSLASSLALEAIFSEMGKQVFMYCGVDMPSYLRYMNGWDRVSRNLPENFELSVIVDTNSLLLLENLQKTGEIKWLKTKPCIIIDHHSTETTIDFASVEYIAPAVSTGELIYGLAKEYDWAIPLDGAQFIVYSILSDSLGLISESTSSDSVRIVAELMDRGVSLAALDAKRKEFQKKHPELLGYKGNLLKRVAYSDSGKIAYISIPWEEIEKYSPLYNPSVLVIDEMRQVEGVKVAIAFKNYPDGRITAKLRSNYGYPVCAAVAEQFGGGGHPYASGFRVTDGKSLGEVQEKCFKLIDEELAKSEK
ncbi:MAG TPA: DHH family phosphoesterase [Candidatus Saccharimonadales bacterium]|nr:DHH family phosphoesterase [Candidatus Saccharimonadales bacterium]